MQSSLQRCKFLVVLLLSLFVAACGSSSNDTAATPTATTSISGSVFAAAMDGAALTVCNSSGSVVAGPVLTAADGSYTIDVPTALLAETLQFKATGGSFTDEATATPGVAGGNMNASIPPNTLGTGSAVHITPATTIIHGMLAANPALTPAQAVTYFNTAFGFTPDPAVAPQVTAPTATNLPQRLAALRAGAFSYLTANCTLAPGQQFPLLAAIAADLADGNLDGKDASLVTISIDGTTNLPTDLQYRYAGAMSACGSGTGVLGLSATSVRTANYVVDFIPGAIGAKVGKTTFNLRLSAAVGGAAVTGKTITLSPVMHMSNKVHGSPVDPVVVDNGDGTYTCTIYYLMASGATMGFWELQVAVDGETATFYPEVGMAMGTASVKLYGVSDKIPGLPGGDPAKRTWLLFKDGVNAGTNTFNLFLAARDDGTMMSFPAVSGNSTLHSETGAAWMVDPATTAISVSTDNVTYITATDNGNGHWSASDPALILGAGATVYVKLTVNGEAKTDLVGTATTATFTLP